MSCIIYAVENTNEQEIERYVNSNTNLPRLNFNEYTEDKPSVNEVDPTTYLVINNKSENAEVKQNTVENAIEKFNEIIIPVTSISITEIQELLAEDVQVHLPRCGLILTRHTNVSDEVIDVLSDYSNDRVLRRHAGGRSPVGTDVQDGFLVRGEDYNNVRKTLTQYRRGDISRETAADRINTTTRTVERAAERDELYQLN